MVKHRVDGSLRAKDQARNGGMTLDWEWYRKDGSLMRRGRFESGEQVGERSTHGTMGRLVKTTIPKPRKET